MELYWEGRSIISRKVNVIAKGGEIDFQSWDLANSKLDGILFKEVKGYIKIWHDINYGDSMRNHRKMVGILCCYVILFM